MMHAATAYLGTTLLALATVACSGDDTSNNSATAATTIGLTAGVGTTMGDATTMTEGASATMDTTGGIDGTEGSGPTATMGSSEGGPMGGPTCQHQCTTPAECFINGDDAGLGCNAGRCTFACTGDPECVAVFSLWRIVDCAGDGECSGGVCVDRGDGTGGCSLQPSQGPCADAGLVDMQATAIGGGMVQVCGQPEGACVPLGAQNACIVGCVDVGPSACAADLTCGADRLCHCEFDTQCIDAGTGNNCNAAGLCEFACQLPGDCPGHPFDGGTLLCE